MLSLEVQLSSACPNVSLQSQRGTHRQIESDYSYPTSGNFMTRWKEAHGLFQLYFPWCLQITDFVCPTLWLLNVNKFTSLFIQWKWPRLPGGEGGLWLMLCHNNECFFGTPRIKLRSILLPGSRRSSQLHKMYQSQCAAKNSWWWAERLPKTCRVPSYSW